MRFGLIADFVDRIDCDEGGGVGLFDVVHQFFVFLIVHDGDDFPADDVVVRADGIIQGCAAVEIVQDELCDLVHLRGEDADAALEVQTEDEVVDDHAAEIGADDADDDGFCVVADCGRQRDDHAGDGHCLSEIHAEIAVHDFCDDVETAGGSVAGEEKCKTDTDDEDIADRIEEGVSGKRLEIREEDFEHAHDRGHEDGGIDGFCAEFGTDQKEADQKQNDVQRKGDRGDGKGNKIADDHSKCGAAADGDMAREHEEVHGDGNNGGADGDNEKFADGSFVDHGRNLLVTE